MASGEPWCGTVNTNPTWHQCLWHQQQHICATTTNTWPLHTAALTRWFLGLLLGRDAAGQVQYSVVQVEGAMERPLPLLIKTGMIAVSTQCGAGAVALRGGFW